MSSRALSRSCRSSAAPQRAAHLESDELRCQRHGAAGAGHGHGPEHPVGQRGGADGGDLVAGAVIVWRVGRAHISATYVIAFFLFSLVRSAVTGSPWLAAVAPITGPMYQLFIFFMMTDPKTTVRSNFRSMRGRGDRGVRRDADAAGRDPVHTLLRTLLRGLDCDDRRDRARRAQARAVSALAGRPQHQRSLPPRPQPALKRKRLAEALLSKCRRPACDRQRGCQSDSDPSVPGSKFQVPGSRFADSRGPAWSVH